MRIAVPPVVACLLLGLVGPSAARAQDAPSPAQEAAPSTTLSETNAVPVPPPQAPAEVLQVAGPPPERPPPPRRPRRPPRDLPEPRRSTRVSDGAGPRLGFGRVWTEDQNRGYYGRFESEYFEISGLTIVGSTVGFEGWGTEGGTGGGAALPLGVFAGLRGGPFQGPKAPLLFVSVGVGIDAFVFDRLDDQTAFGLLSPFGSATAGMELVPGLRLLGEGRAVYRWHWTAPNVEQLQVGLTLGANSTLWDGP